MLLGWPNIADNLIIIRCLVGTNVRFPRARDKAALSSGCKAHPAISLRRKQPGLGKIILARRKVGSANSQFTLMVELHCTISLRRGRSTLKRRRPFANTTERSRSETGRVGAPISRHDRLQNDLSSAEVR